MLGSPQHPLSCRLPHHKVLVVWGDPWDVGSTPWSGFARPTMAPQIHTPTSSILPAH